MILIRINILAFLIGVMFFAQSRSALADEEVPAVAEVIDLIELIQNAEEFDGRVVEVTGFYVRKGGSAYLFPDKEAYKALDFRHAVWVGHYDPEFLDDWRGRCDGCVVIVLGVFRNEITGIFGYLPGQIVNVTRFERTDKPINVRRRHQPW